MAFSNEDIDKIMMYACCSNVELDSYAYEYINNLLHMFDKKNDTDILEMLDGELKKCAINEYKKKNSVIEYLVAEILELAGNLTQDKIYSEHIYKVIMEDHELNKLFDPVCQPNNKKKVEKNICNVNPLS